MTRSSRPARCRHLPHRLHTATWSNHSRPIVAVLTPSTLDVVCAETEADAVRSRVPGVTVHPYVELRSPDGSRSPRWSDPVHPTRLRGARQRAEERDAQIRGRRARRGAPADVPSSTFCRQHRAVRRVPAIVGRASAQERLGNRADAHRVRHPRSRLRGPPRRAQTGDERARHPQHPRRRQFCPRRAPSRLHDGRRRCRARSVRRPDRATLAEGEVLFVDGGVVVDGYWAYCRMYTAALRRRPSATTTLAPPLPSMPPGTRCCPTASSLGRAIGSALDLPPGSVGFGRFGHGIGLYMPEPPSLHPDDPTPR